MVISDEKFIEQIADEVAKRLRKQTAEDRWRYYQPYWIDPRYAPWPYTGPHHVYPYWNPVTCKTRADTTTYTGPNLTSWNPPAYNTVD